MRSRASKILPNQVITLYRKVRSWVPMKYRMSGEYWRISAFLRKAQWWNKQEIKEWQTTRLRQIVRYAYDNVPGYHLLYKEAGLVPENIQTLNDIRCLPFVTKELLRDNLKDFISRSIPEQKRFYVTTGGSTGIPFGFYYTHLNWSMEDAFIHAGWERAGWTLISDRSSAVLRGGFVGSEDQFWRFDDDSRELLLSSYHLNETSLSKYIDKMLEFKPLHLKAYPSVATNLADLIITTGYKSKLDFEVILLGSENLFDWQMVKLSNAFPQARNFAWYGQTEQVILAPMCETSNKYHIWPFYGFTEILGDDSEEVGVCEVGELVGTSFWNYATPFIRYRSMDLAEKGKAECSECGRKFQLINNIEGRVKDTLVTQAGNQIPVPSTSIHSEVFDNVKQFQFYQDTPGKVTLRIIKKKTYSKADTRRICNDLQVKLGSGIDLKFVFINEIPRTPRGKYRFLEQRLEIIR